MAELLGTGYDALSLEIDGSESRQRALSSEPAPAKSTASTIFWTPKPASLPQAAATAQPAGLSTELAFKEASTRAAMVSAAGSGLVEEEAAAPVRADRDGQPVQGHIVSPAPTTERMQCVQGQVSSQLGDRLLDFDTNASCAIPFLVGGLYPISDVWHIEPGLDEPSRLRVHIAQFAREIAEEAAVANQIVPSDSGIGFVCMIPRVGQVSALPDFPRALLALLHALSMPESIATGLNRARLDNDLAPLLHGAGAASTRLSDTGLMKLFRLLRLARRLRDLEHSTGFADQGRDS
ncbi:hypothetical protein [Cupriavidus necator]|uniref:hypothetical protein n=1 Tax=Cupriavidus necator TaxID=106590 RepID=UPI001892A30F|nr:hypothetical protein [Cupriavidus necator]